MLFFKHSPRFIFILRLLFISFVVFQANAESSVEIRKSPLDQRQYMGLYLDNGLKVLLVSDPGAEKAAAALNVAVGSFSEQPERQGLAHFLEHMLFLGTKKYPNASEYSEYINSHGGSNNAWTDDQNTQYFFNVLPDHLLGALDRFSQFFVEPLFNADLVDRERHAVDSEYHLSLKKDGWRINEVKKVTANPAHPAVQFSMGNLHSLADTGHARPVREDLVQFYNDYYSADRMTLAVVAPQPLAQLENMVKQYFSAIPKRQVKNNIIEPLVYTTKETAKQISIRTFGDYQELSLSFPIPSQRTKFNNLSIDYILFQIKQTGPRSLYQLLKNKNWITNINASSNELTYNQDLANINFSLTNNGQQHIEQIIQYTFSYLNFMRKIGPQKKMFEELRQAGEREFVYEEKLSPVTYAAALPMAMQHYPLDQVLTAGRFNKSTIFDPEGITDLLSYFKPKNMRLYIVNNKITGDLLEKNYKVRYNLNDVDSKRMAKWEAATSDTDFSFPKSNDFLPKNFRLLDRVDGVSVDSVPTQIEKEPGLTLWHKQDQNFNLPRQNLMFLLCAPNMQNTAKQAVMQKLMLYSMHDKLTELSTQFSMAGINLSLYGNEEGLILNLLMFSDKQAETISEVLKYIQDYKIDPIRFAIYKEDISRSLSNFKQNSPFIQGMAILNRMLLEPSWLPHEMLAEVNEVTIKDVEQFTKDFFAYIQIESLMHGNISASAAKELMTKITKQLPVNKSHMTRQALPKLISLPKAAKFHYAFDPDHNDASVVSYYQAPKKDDMIIAINALLLDLIDTPLFEQLRTKEQLGYAVGITVQRVREQTGAIFYIESPTRNPNYLNIRFNNFLKNFSKTLANMPAKKLDVFKSSLTANLLKKPHSLAAETSRYWEQITNGTYRFNFNKEIAESLKPITIYDVNIYFSELFMDPKIRRNLIVHTIDNEETFLGGELLNSVQQLHLK